MEKEKKAEFKIMYKYDHDDVTSVSCYSSSFEFTIFIFIGIIL